MVLNLQPLSYDKCSEDLENPLLNLFSYISHPVKHHKTIKFTLLFLLLNFT